MYSCHTKFFIVVCFDMTVCPQENMPKEGIGQAYGPLAYGRSSGRSGAGGEQEASREVPRASRRKSHFAHRLIWIPDALSVYFLVVTLGFELSLV